MSDYELRLKNMSESIVTAIDSTMDQNFRTWLGQFYTVLNKPRVTVTFGGHFNSGKSSLINALIGRDFLPTDDLPETGAICLLRSGGADEIVVHTDEGRRAIDFTREAIRSEVSLISAEGAFRDKVNQVKRLDITFENGVVPPNLTWIDSPGINDVGDMTERAREAALFGDVLIWVLNSRQILSEVEMGFIADHIAQRGPLSVLFVLNVFLTTDSGEEWQKYCDEKLPRIRTKLYDFSERMGFSPNEKPEIVPVSARGLAQAPQNGFGGSEFWYGVRGMENLSHPRIVRARLDQVLTGLRQAEAKCCVQIVAFEDSIAKERQAGEEQRLATEKSISQGNYAFNSAYDAARFKFISEVQRQAASIKQTVDAENLLHDETYRKMLQAAVDAASQAALIELDGELTRKSDRLAPGTPAEIQLAFRQATGAVKVYINAPFPVPQRDPTPMIVGGIIGAIIGIFIFGIGIIPLGLIGVAIGYFIAESNTTTAHVKGRKDQIKLKIDSETEKAINKLKDQQTVIAGLLSPQSAKAISPAPHSDEARLAALKDNRKILGDLIAKAQTLL